jgi:RNA polymerase sigma-70 factor, ECF subfamily
MSAYAAGTLTMDIIPGGDIESRLTGRAKRIHELDDIDALVRNHKARLLRFIVCSTGDPDLAETVTQDALLRAYNGRDKFRGDCSVSTWITGIAINVLRDVRRTERYKFWKRVKATAVDVQEMASYLPANGSSPESQLLAKEKVERLGRLLETLSRNQRMIFLMKFSEEMPVAEIGEVLGMPVATVRTHLHRALKAVRGQLGA